MPHISDARAVPQLQRSLHIPKQSQSTGGENLPPATSEKSEKSINGRGKPPTQNFGEALRSALRVSGGSGSVSGITNYSIFMEIQVSTIRDLESACPSFTA